MKFVIAPDSFKGSFTAKEIGEFIERGLKKIFPKADYIMVPMADGGEGTVQALVDATRGKFISQRVVGPLGKRVKATYGMLGNSKTAVIEMSSASGLQFVNEKTRDPLVTTTYGTGQLIISALDHGAKKIIMGMGGSATNDGGAGMAQALGVKLLGQEHQNLSFGGDQLHKLQTIDLSNLDPRIKDVPILIASDVSNPLIGPTGASSVFGPQKGATSEMVKILDQNLKHYANVIKQTTGKSLSYLPGAGSAGGLGGGLLAFTKSVMKKGIDITVQYTHLKEKSQGANFVFTGEGGIDFQTKYGKTPYGVALATKKVAPQAPVIVLAGNIGKDVEELYSKGAIDAIFSTPSGAKSLKQAMADSEPDMILTAENIGRLIKSIK